MEDSKRIAYLSALHLLEGLEAAGVKVIFTSPGFRNSPVLAALAMRSSFTVISHIDERGAAFAALGAAKASGRPAAVLCTSGTAAGNFLPAVMEAWHGRVPLVAITADRPPELIGVGANQATQQPGIFSEFARTLDLAVPSAESAAQWGTYVCDAIGEAVRNHRPAHVNARFREPFTFSEADVTATPPELLRSRVCSEKQPVARDAAGGLPSAPPLEKTVVLLGEGVSGEEQIRLSSLCRSRGIPLVANLHAASSVAEEVILRGDSFLRATSWRERLRALHIVRVGAPLVGRQYSWLWKSAERRWVIDEEARDPDLMSSEKIRMAPGSWMEHWLPGGCSNPEWTAMWDRAEREAEGAIASACGGAATGGSLTEWAVWVSLNQWLPGEAQLLVGNSMPIRDFLWAAPASKDRTVFVNRGLSGIDGLLSTAIGACAATERVTVAVVGDLSTIHDSSAFSFGNHYPVTVVVLNNGGGEIFRVVEAGEYPVKEEVFTTPNTVDFVALAGAFGWKARRVKTLSELTSAVRERGPLLVEVMIDREASGASRRAVWKTFA